MTMSLLLGTRWLRNREKERCAIDTQHEHDEHFRRTE